MGIKPSLNGKTLAWSSILSLYKNLIHFHQLVERTNQNDMNTLQTINYILGCFHNFCSAIAILHSLQQVCIYVLGCGVLVWSACGERLSPKTEWNISTPKCLWLITAAISWKWFPCILYRTRTRKDTLVQSWIYLNYFCFQIFAAIVRWKIPLCILGCSIEKSKSTMKR